MTNQEIREANIYKPTVEMRNRVCDVCGQRIPFNSLAMASHGNKHVREGTVEVVWYKGVGHDFPVKRYVHKEVQS